MSTLPSTPQSELGLQISRFLDELRRSNVSPHTVAAYGSDLAQFLARAADRGVLLAPGPSFGPYPKHARLCFTAAAPDVTRRGVERLADLLGR